MSLPHTPMQNQLLAALPAADYARLLPDLELVTMPAGWVLCEPGEQLAYVYFPLTSIVSMLYVTADGASTEIAIVGNEGLVGISLFMGGDSTLSQATVQTAGEAYRLGAGIVKTEFALGGQLQQLALRFTQALLTQMAQTAACNRHHSIDQRFCRWLLGCLDRLKDNELLVTHDLIAHALGVRREGVTAAAHNLQAQGMIRIGRGNIKILDRSKLEQRVCECYAVVKREYDRLLPDEAGIPPSAATPPAGVHPLSHRPARASGKRVVGMALT